jgi:F-type H+-transporting ATPase subunit delta
MSAAAGGEHVAVPPTVFDEKAGELARTYGDALVGAAIQAGNPDEILDELAAIRDFVLTRFPTFAVMMTSPVRSVADKDKVIVRAFEGRALPTSVHFLRVLNRRGRLGLLGPVLRSARSEWERRQNRRPVRVRSAVPLAEGELESLRETLARSLQATPVITAEVDPALIGGLVVQVGDVVYDGSIRNRLEQLRHRLIQG